MARPSKLTPHQWQEVEARRATGEGWRSIAKAFGVDESTIRVRGKDFPAIPAVRETAQKIVDARTAMAELPAAHQYTAMRLADHLQNIGNSLAEAASLGAGTAKLLQQHAAKEAAEIATAPTPAAKGDCLRTVQALTKVANEASHIGLNLLAAQARERNRPSDDLTPAAAVLGAAVPVFNITLADE